MEDNEDEPEDVKNATPVEEEIRRGEIDEYSGKPVKPFEATGRGHHRCEKNVVKKIKGKPIKSEGECCRAKKAKAAKAPKTVKAFVYEKECTLPRIKAIPRHCLTKQEWINILATPSRKCPSPCLRKEVTRRLRPVSARMAELAQPPKQRLLNTLESRAGTLPTELIDNLIQTLEGETCLTPEQAEKLFRDKDIRAKKKCRKRRSKLKCGSEKLKNLGTSGVTSNISPFDKEAVNCQYIMAEGFVRSILDWKCPIPREEFKDIAEVILKRLTFILEYNPLNGEDRKSQQMRYLADIIGSWISGVLFEVAETRREQLDEECEKRRQANEEETDDDSDDETDEEVDFGIKDEDVDKDDDEDDDDDDDEDDDDDGDEQEKKKDSRRQLKRGRDDEEKRRKKKGEKDAKDDDDEEKKKKGKTRESEKLFEGTDDSAGKIDEEAKKASAKNEKVTEKRPEDESRDETLEDEKIVQAGSEKEVDEIGRNKDGDGQAEIQEKSGKIDKIDDKEETNEKPGEKILEANALPVTTEKDSEIEKHDDDDPSSKIDGDKNVAKDSEGTDDREKSEIDQFLADSKKTIDKRSSGGDNETEGVKGATSPEEISTMDPAKKSKLGEEEIPQIGQSVGADGKMVESPEETSATTAMKTIEDGDGKGPEIDKGIASGDKMDESLKKTIKDDDGKGPEIDKGIASGDKMDESLKPARISEDEETLKDQSEVTPDSRRTTVVRESDKVRKDLKKSPKGSAIPILTQKSQDRARASKDGMKLKKMLEISRSADGSRKLSGEPEGMEISEKLVKIMAEKKHRTDTPFVTFDKIFHTIYNAIEEREENPGTDPISNRIHRAVYEKFSRIVEEENPGPVAELTRDVIDVMSGKIALWLRQIMTESEHDFVDKFPATVESTKVKECTQWVSNAADTVDDWSAWIQNTIRQVENMSAGKVTRGDYSDWTKSVNIDASRWRRFYLESVHRAHQNLTTIRDGHVVKTGMRRLTEYNDQHNDDNERVIRTTDLEVERRNVD